MQSICSLAFMLTLLIILPSCGKHEADAGVVGTLAGGIIGATVTSKKDSGVGALVGGLIGNTLGRSMGRACDEEEEQEIQAHHRAVTSRKIANLETENRNLRNDMMRWCGRCRTQIKLIGASSCPTCGDGLIREKFCRQCTVTFTPQSGYRYCPYCKEGVLLSSR